MTASCKISAKTRRADGRLVALVLTLVGALVTSATFAAESAPPPAPLPVDAAFASVAAFEAGKFVVKIDVLPGHYLYRDRFELQANGQPISKLVLPKGKIKQDPTFGRVEVYEQPMSLSALTKLSGSAELTLTYQGCSALAGVCYPPTRRSFALSAGAKDVRAQELPAMSLTQQFKKQVSR